MACLHTHPVLPIQDTRFQPDCFRHLAVLSSHRTSHEAGDIAAIAVACDGVGTESVRARTRFSTACENERLSLALEGTPPLPDGDRRYRGHARLRRKPQGLTDDADDDRELGWRWGWVRVWRVLLKKTDGGRARHRVKRGSHFGRRKKI